MAHSEERWQEAKRKCRLTTEEIELVKRLGLNPKSLIKNIPNKNQQWKAPVGEWLRDIEATRNENAERKKKKKE